MLIKTSLPWTSWIRKENINILFIGNGLPIGKLFPTIKGNRIGDFDNQAVVVQKGSIQETIAKDTLKDSNITPLTKVGEMVAEVSNGKVQALVLEEAIAKGYAEKNKNLAIAEVELPSDEADSYAVAMPKSSKKLTKKVNDVIKSLKEEDKINTFVQEAYDLSVKQ